MEAHQACRGAGPLEKRMGYPEEIWLRFGEENVKVCYPVFLEYLAANLYNTIEEGGSYVARNPWHKQMWHVWHKG